MFLPAGGCDLVHVPLISKRSGKHNLLGGRCPHHSDGKRCSLVRIVFTIERRSLMKVLRTQDTQHIAIDLKKAEQFLLAHQFTQAVLNHLAILVVPDESCEDIEEEDVLFDDIQVVLTLFEAVTVADGLDNHQMTKQLLYYARSAVYEEYEMPWCDANCAEQLRLWGMLEGHGTVEQVHKREDLRTWEALVGKHSEHYVRYATDIYPLVEEAASVG